MCIFYIEMYKMGTGADLELNQGRVQAMEPQKCISNFMLKYIGVKGGVRTPLTPDPLNPLGGGGADFYEISLHCVTNKF